ncbi:hypothetical protein HOY82DRAFT_538049 [Tuber indicum]|nr:hypothetical protein HOY82DRAFT_538049 [Tuber indicum]
MIFNYQKILSFAHKAGLAIAIVFIIGRVTNRPGRPGMVGPGSPSRASSHAPPSVPSGLKDGRTSRLGTLEREIASAFTTGAVPDIALTYFVDRPGISKKIASILQLPEDYYSYDLIISYEGTGKTTPVRHVGHQCAGVIYVDIKAGATSEEGFAKTFANAIHCVLLGMQGIGHRENKPCLTISKVKDSNMQSGSGDLFEKAFDRFSGQADKYFKQTGRSIVLVIDNVDHLAVSNPLLPDHLQDMAKYTADSCAFITLFVSTQGHSVLQMLGIWILFVKSYITGNSG